VTHIYNPSAREAEGTGSSLQGQPRLHRNQPLLQAQGHQGPHPSCLR
jgi:hypothetical protein